jgi:hypothetical protein
MHVVSGAGRTQTRQGMAVHENCGVVYVALRKGSGTSPSQWEKLVEQGLAAECARVTGKCAR